MTQPKTSNAILVEKAVILLLFALLLAGVFFILRPFLVGLLFGCILAVAAWPVRSWLVGRGLSGTVASMVMLAALLLFVLVPVVVMAPGLVTEMAALGERIIAWLTSSPPLPAWIGELPLVGPGIAAKWQTMMSGTPEAQNLILSYARPVREFFTSAAVGLASSIVQIAVALIFATSFWSRALRCTLTIWWPPSSPPRSIPSRSFRRNAISIR